MDNLKQAIMAENRINLSFVLTKLDTEDGLKESMLQYGKTYKKNPKHNFIKFLTKRYMVEQQQKFKQIDLVNNAGDFDSELIITIEWKASRMWRSNPKAYTNYGFISRSICGCGYDKLSTAIAEALNSHLPILKMLYRKKNYDLLTWKDGDIKNDYNREVLGYGSGYGILPCFEGGVGVESHKTILARLGLEMRQVSNTNNTNVFIIKKKTEV